MGPTLPSVLQGESLLIKVRKFLRLSARIVTGTTFARVTSGELWITLQFIGDNPIAFLDNVTIAITSATGQLFIFYTIKTFGPIVFTIIMTTRQMFSIVLSTVIFGHAIKPLMGIGAIIVFATIFNRIKRQAAKRKQAVPVVAGGK